jgi:hypothetical protein
MAQLPKGPSLQLHLSPVARAAALLCAGLAVALPLTVSAPLASAAGPEAGSVHFARAAEASLDRYTSSPSAAQATFMRERFWRMRTYAPYFDERLSWYPDAWTYRDLYAVYRDDRLAQEHPEWILHDAAGQKLYIPYDCGGGTCTQYAGDIGDPAFRAHWIAEARTQAADYRGIFVDDVNLESRVSDGQGDQVMPVDERTGSTMTESDWRRYVAEFTEEIARALPGKEIVHNALWFAGHDDPSVQRELQAATHVEIERGVNDPGLTGGRGQFGYETLLDHVDWLHAHGTGVVMDSYADTRAKVEYELASYFLVSSGRDGVGTGWRSAPGDWWAGYDVKLGAPRGPRYDWQGLIRRDFEDGFVLVNQPGAKTATVALGAGARDATGEPRSSISLSGAEGAVVTTGGGSPARPSLVPTRTRVQPVPNPLVRPADRARGAALRGAAGHAVPVRRKLSRGMLSAGRLRRAVLVYGRVYRAPARARVVLHLQRRNAGGWVGVRTRRATLNARGRFQRLFWRAAPGRYRVVALYRGTRKTRRSQATRGFAMRR